MLVHFPDRIMNIFIDMYYSKDIFDSMNPNPKKLHTPYQFSHIGE